MLAGNGGQSPMDAPCSREEPPLSRPGQPLPPLLIPRCLCAYVCTRMYIHRCMCIFCFVYILYINVYIFTYIHTYIQGGAHTNTHTHTPTYIIVYICTCLHTCVYHMHSVSIHCEDPHKTQLLLARSAEAMWR